MQRRSFWPVPGPEVEFLPVGPWNTDGLIIVPDELTEAQQRYVRDLQATGFPVIFTTPEGAGPLVKVDNARFSRMVVPGDRLELEVVLKRRIRNMAQYVGIARFDGEPAACAEILCAAARE